MSLFFILNTTKQQKQTPKQLKKIIKIYKKIGNYKTLIFII